MSSQLADKGVLGTFAATDSKSGKKVVLKALDEESCDPSLKLAFLRSHEQLSNIDLPFVPKVGPICKKNKVLFFESEFVPGLPFGKAIAARRNSRPKLLACLFSALSELHSSGEFHGALKPNNVLYDADEGKLFLLDLGFWGYKQWEPRNTSGRIYWAPELRRTRLADVRSDFYGFGLLAFGLFTGLQVDNEALAGLLSHDREAAGEWLRTHAKNIQSDVLNLILETTSPRLSQRPQSCIELLELLRPVLGTKQIGSIRAPEKVPFALCAEFVGRNDVLKRLHTAMEDARRRGVGAAKVVGETGSGKSRIAQEFLFECEERGYRVARSSCFLLALNPYCNVLQLLETAAEHVDRDRSQALLALADAVRADLLKLLKRPARRSVHLCGVNLPAGAEALRRKVLQAMMDLVKGEFWVFVLDDAHSILGPGASLLSELMRQLAEKARKKTRTKGGLFVVLTVPDFGRQGPSLKGPDVRFQRPPLASIDVLGSRAIIETINLDVLEEDPARLLVESIVGSRKPLRDFSSFLYDRFGGRPAWLAAGARLICSTKGISTPVDDGSAGHLEALDGHEEIPNAEHLAEAMTSALDTASKKLLEAVAVLPAFRKLDLIEAVFDADDQGTIHRIDELCRKGILVWQHAGSSVFVDFGHELFKQACLGSVPDERILEIHQRAAKYWEQLSSGEGPEVPSHLNLNYHLAKSDGDQSSLEFLESLSAVFQSGGCYFRAAELLEEAIDLFSATALGLSDSARDTYGTKLYCRRGDLNLLLSDYRRALRDYAKALSFAQDARSIPDQCACNLRMAEVHRLTGELHRALEVLGEAKSVAAAHKDVRNQAMAAHAIGKAYWHQGKLNDALRSFNTALECAEEMKDESERGAILHNIGSVYWAQGNYERAKERFTQAKKICEKVGEEHMRAITLNSIGSTHAEQSETKLAMEHFSEALSVFQRLGDRRNMSTTLQNLASCLFWMGDIGPSLERIEDAISIKKIIGDIGGRSAALITRGEILREMGDYDGALSAHYEAFQTLMSQNEPLISDTALLQIGLDHLEFGAIESAFFSLELLLSRRDEIKPSTAVSAILGLARAHLEAGNRDKTVKLCNEVLSLLEGVRRPIEEASCLITLSRVHVRDERLHDAGDCLRRASSTIKELNSPFPQFQLYWALGDYHLKTNNLAESYTSYAHAASRLEALAATLPEDKQELFAKKRSLERFRMRWGAIRLELDEDAPGRTQPKDAWAGDEEVAASMVRVATGSTGMELIQASDIIISHLLAATPFERGCIAIRADSGRLRLTRALNKSGRVLDPKQLGGPASVSRHVNLTGTPVLTRRGAEKPDWLRDLDISGSIMCVPLCGKRERLGTIYLDSTELLEMPSDHPLLAVQSLERLATKMIEDAVLRERQNAYIKELVDRTRLLSGERGVPPMLVPGTTIRSEKASAFPELIGASERLLEVIREAVKIVKTDVTISITGETGTGKELLAQAIHRRSLRKDAPLLVINCGAIPRDLVEAELFGFEKGAFTGAHKQKRGRLEYGDKGTIFLDEIAELSLDMQVKLLRFLETKTIERIGGAGEIEIDCRIIAATNRNLETAVKDGSFREDLYYRLSVIHLELPPIREREDDILRLANHFLSLGKEKYNKRKKMFSVKAVERMMSHRWPGNVRELQNKVEKAILISTGNTITDADLGLIRREDSQIARLKEVKDGVEASRLKTALRASGGNVAQAARMAGLSRQNFYRLLKKHSLSLDEYRPSGRS